MFWSSSDVHMCVKYQTWSKTSREPQCSSILSTHALVKNPIVAFSLSFSRIHPLLFLFVCHWKISAVIPLALDLLLLLFLPLIVFLPASPLWLLHNVWESQRKKEHKAVERSLCRLGCSCLFVFQRTAALHFGSITQASGLALQEGQHTLPPYYSPTYNYH